MDPELLKKILEDDGVKEIVLRTLMPKEWMNIHEAAQYLSLSVRSVYRLIENNQIPFKYIPGTKKIRFKKRHIDLWLETGKNIMIDRIPAKVIKEINKYDE